MSASKTTYYLGCPIYDTDNGYEIEVNGQVYSARTYFDAKRKIAMYKR